MCCPFCKDIYSLVRTSTLLHRAAGTSAKTFYSDFLVICLLCYYLHEFKSIILCFFPYLTKFSLYYEKRKLQIAENSQVTTWSQDLSFKAILVDNLLFSLIVNVII